MLVGSSRLLSELIVSYQPKSVTRQSFGFQVAQKLI
jgi:hypothetical protein